MGPGRAADVVAMLSIVCPVVGGDAVLSRAISRSGRRVFTLLHGPARIDQDHIGDLEHACVDGIAQCAH